MIVFLLFNNCFDKGGLIMKLQCAFDIVTFDDYFKILEEIHDLIDIIEIGTPLALRYGSDLIRETKKRYPESKIVADYKICDGGEHIANVAFDADADFVTVMAFAHNETIKGVIESAKRHKKSAMVDMMRIENVAERATQAIDMGADYVCLHNATDAHDFKRAICRIKSVCDVVDSSHISIAGKISLNNIEKIKPYYPAIIISGGCITEAKNKREMVIKLKEAYKK